MINITIAYVDDNGKPYYGAFTVPVGTSIRTALTLSNWLELPEFHWLNDWVNQTDDSTAPNHKAWHIGIFSQKKSLGTILENGDRIEIYRTLRLDPMKTRQKKANATNKQKALAIQAKNIARKDERKKAENGEFSA